MTTDEFRTWLKKHMNCFPGIASWLSKMAKSSDTDGMSRDGILKQWSGCLHDVSLEDANLATDLLFRGEEEEPKSFDSHPRAVRRIAKKFSGKRSSETKERRYFSHEEAFRCLDCQDSGVITIVHSKSIRAARNGDLFNRKHNAIGKTGLYSAAVACGCEEGNRMLKMLEVHYEPQRMVLWTLDDDQMYEEILALVADGAADRQSRYADPLFSGGFGE